MYNTTQKYQDQKIGREKDMSTATAVATAKAMIEEAKGPSIKNGTGTVRVNIWFVEAVKAQLVGTLPRMILNNSVDVQKEDVGSRIICSVGSIKIIFCLSMTIPTDVGIEFLDFGWPGQGLRGQIWCEMVSRKLVLQFITNEGVAAEVPLPCLHKDKFVKMLKSLGDCCMPVLRDNVEDELKEWARALPALIS